MDIKVCFGVLPLPLSTTTLSALASFCLSSFARNLEPLRQLLLRVHCVIEEAEGRYFTNSRMVLHLNMLKEAMHRGSEHRWSVEASGSYTMAFPIICRIGSKEVQTALETLESATTEMNKFIKLLTGCERMFRGQSSCYLYMDNFMFGRQVELFLTKN
ncbi:hypothetical protein QYE76_033758 [Lolium multiflorum]|uniref:Uncharacterized protein n=1 Tax=Lolium multiflorum TaxID=4521 RepID=A0AAD8VMD5_LOLMU|nr:hypothetical protein QYE76_033758 [Lolium multiflorum]